MELSIRAERRPVRSSSNVDLQCFRDSGPQLLKAGVGKCSASGKLSQAQTGSMPGIVRNLILKKFQDIAHNLIAKLLHLSC